MAGAIWAVTEVGAGGLKGISNEVVACGQKLAQALGKPLEAVVIGSGARGAAEKVAAKDVTTVRLIDDPALDPYTPDAFTAALRQAIQAEAPELVLFPHTYQVRDWVPRLAAELDTGFVSDVIDHRVEDGRVLGVRRVPEQPDDQRGRERDGDLDDDEAECDERHPVLAEALPEELPRRARDDPGARRRGEHALADCLCRAHALRFARATCQSHRATGRSKGCTSPAMRGWEDVPTADGGRRRKSAGRRIPRGAAGGDPVSVNSMVSTKEGT